MMCERNLEKISYENEQKVDLFKVNKILALLCSYFDKQSMTPALMYIGVTNGRKI
jgi:hypothetical protein